MTDDKKSQAAWAVEVVVPRPLPPLAYVSKDPLPLGGRVVVPLKNRLVVGVVRSCRPLVNPRPGLRPVEKKLDAGALIPEDLWCFLEWVADYYFVPLGKVLKTALPPGFLKVPGPRSRKIPVVEDLPHVFSKKTPEVYEALVFAHPDPAKRLEKYVALCQEALYRGKSVLFLVPEIVDFERIHPILEKELGEALHLYAGHLSAKARREVWLKCLDPAPKVVLGLRAAVFLPFSPGLFILEKEASSSYWQEEGLRYQARNLALVRARALGARVVLGGHVPAVSSYYHATCQRYTWLSRVSRPSGPRLEVEDLSQGQGYLSVRLLNALKLAKARGEKALLFLNRRGFSPVLRCEACGHVWECEQCGFTLTYHREEGLLRCHLCGHSLPAPPLCPVCGQEEVRFLGAGTERLEEILLRLLPGARVLRVDAESAGRARQLAAVKQALPETDIIVGTRLVRRLGQIPGLKVIGVVLADQGLRFPDYRAPERTLETLVDLFELLPPKGRFILQTFYPEHYVIKAFAAGEYRLFFHEELRRRKALDFPPFSRLILLELRTKDPQRGEDLALKAEKFLSAQGVAVLGPSPAPFFQVKGFFRWHLLLRAKNFAPLQQALRNLLKELAGEKGLKILIDPDPEETL